MAILISWLFSIGFESNRKVSQQFQKKPTLLIASALIPISYAVFLFLTVFSNAEFGKPPKISGFIIPIHILSMFCMFYLLWFASKQLVTLQKKDRVKFIEHSGPFFLLWFFPIGVWFVQPVVNKELGENDL
ncbi:MAG: hypothetical protein KTR18_08290 [Acidiferrobacterales bacterium]|nr:hypothetical protein [Acidiferrobacterales bacterium]